MASSLRTKLRIAGSVLFATGFWDAVAGRFLWEPRARSNRTFTSQDAVAEARRGWRDLAGAVHVHSTYSDGAGDVPTVMEAARKAGMDWVLLTDHNSHQPKRDGWEEKYAGTPPLLLIGTEVTVEYGAFLLALDLPPEWETAPGQKPQTVVNDVLARGGLPLVSLPFDVKHPWRDWNVTGCAGLEVINLSTVARRHINLFSAAWLVPLYRRKGALAALRALVTRPDQSLATWDRLTSGGRPFVGVAALDAHALMKIGREKYPLPSYEDSFRACCTHVLVKGMWDEATADARRAAIYESLRAGCCYLSYDCLGDPKGFSFTAVPDKGEGAGARMGETVSLRSGAWWLWASLPPAKGQKTLVRLLHDGRVVAAGEGGVSFCATRPGAYRVEVFRVAGHAWGWYGNARPWIFSNPIYVGPEGDNDAGTSAKASASLHGNRARPLADAPPRR
jgi:hypothetical protein